MATFGRLEPAQCDAGDAQRREQREIERGDLTGWHGRWAASGLVVGPQGALKQRQGVWALVVEASTPQN
ncbi:MAG: hypothetical protein ACRDTF_06820 [Pseudonocardiaceae bacterium]